MKLKGFCLRMATKEFWILVTSLKKELELFQSELPKSLSSCVILRMVLEAIFEVFPVASSASNSYDLGWECVLSISFSGDGAEVDNAEGLLMKLRGFCHRMAVKEFWIFVTSQKELKLFRSELPSSSCSCWSCRKFSPAASILRFMRVVGVANACILCSQGRDRCAGGGGGGGGYEEEEEDSREEEWWRHDKDALA